MQKVVLILYVLPELILRLQLLLARMANNPEAIPRQTELAKLRVNLVVLAEDARKTHCVVQFRRARVCLCLCFMFIFVIVLLSAK